MTDNYYDLWKKVPAPSDTRGSDSDPSIPDGEHRATVVGFTAFESGSGDLWLKFVFAILGGLFDGKVLVRMLAPLGRRQDDEEKRRRQIGWAKRDLQVLLGSIPPVMGGLLDPETRKTGPVATEILGAVVAVAKQTKGDHINVYLNDLISPAPSAEDLPLEEESGSDAGDEIRDEDYIPPPTSPSAVGDDEIPW